MKPLEAEVGNARIHADQLREGEISSVFGNFLGLGDFYTRKVLLRPFLDHRLFFKTSFWLLKHPPIWTPKTLDEFLFKMRKPGRFKRCCLKRLLKSMHFLQKRTEKKFRKISRF